jgi:hypothetical protein
MTVNAAHHAPADPHRHSLRQPEGVVQQEQHEVEREQQPAAQVADAPAA